MNSTSAALGASRVEVRASRAVSVEVVVGAAIRCIAGRVWVTQEGDARDHVIPAGTTFFADRAGRAVVTSLESDSVVSVGAPARGWAPGSVRIDSIEQIARAARQAQARYVSRLFSKVFAWL